MKRCVKLWLAVCAALVMTVLVGKVTAYACYGVIASHPIDGGWYMSCNLTGEDASYCYYDCTCTGSQEQCDAAYARNGLESY